VLSPYSFVALLSFIDLAFYICSSNSSTKVVETNYVIIFYFSTKKSFSELLSTEEDQRLKFIEN